MQPIYSIDSAIGHLTITPSPVDTNRQIEHILQTLPTETHSKRKALEKAYELLQPVLLKKERLTPEVAFLLGKILSLFGQSLYGDTNIPNHFSTARTFLLASFNAQFYALGMHDCLVDLRPYATLADMIPEHKRFYTELNSKTTDFNAEVVARQARDAGLSDDKLCNLAFTLRFLNGTYRSLESNQKLIESDQVILKRYINFNELALALLTSKESPQIKQELRELRYNDLPGYYAVLQKPELVKKNYEDLEKEALDPLDRAMLVRIYNKRACNTDNREEQVLYMGKAKDQYDLMFSQERHPILYPLFLNNFGFVLLKGISIDTMVSSSKNLTPELAVVKELFFKAHALAADLRKEGTENVNFLNIDCNYARFNLFIDQLEEAKKTLDHAEQVLQKNPENVAMREKVDLLQAKLELLQGRKLMESNKPQAFLHFQKCKLLSEKYPTASDAINTYKDLKETLQTLQLPT